MSEFINKIWKETYEIILENSGYEVGGGEDQLIKQKVVIFDIWAW